MTSSTELVRPLNGRVIAGVCSAIARRFGIDVTIVRMLWLFGVFCVGTGFLAYFICWIIIPSE